VNQFGAVEGLKTPPRTDLHRTAQPRQLTQTLAMAYWRNGDLELRPLTWELSSSSSSQPYSDAPFSSGEDLVASGRSVARSRETLPSGVAGFRLALARARLAGMTPLGEEASKEFEDHNPFSLIERTPRGGFRPAVGLPTRSLARELRRMAVKVLSAAVSVETKPFFGENEANQPKPPRDASRNARDHFD